MPIITEVETAGYARQIESQMYALERRTRKHCCARCCAFAALKKVRRSIQLAVGLALADNEIDEAIAFAESGGWESAEDLLKDVYS